MSDLLGVLPCKQVVLELLETVGANDDVIKRCDELRRLGYRLALPRRNWRRRNGRTALAALLRRDLTL